MKIKVDFSEKIRPMGHLNGMDNGPIEATTDRTKEFKEMGVDFVRFHETHTYHCKCIETPFIFRDFSKDENDPANYYFDETDAVIKGAVDAGIEICYRFGMGTEPPPQMYTFSSNKTEDFEKYARILEHIVAHYNDGWANGFHYGVKYWEVLNECDLTHYWPQPKVRYVDFYSIVANRLKKRFPDIKIGPCGWATGVRMAPLKINKTTSVVPLSEYPERPHGFVSRAVVAEGEKIGADTPVEITEDTAMALFEEQIMQAHEFGRRYRAGEFPVDFYPFHTYSAELKPLRNKIERMLPYLRDYGLDKLELINTEWNAIHLSRDKHGLWWFDQMYTMHSAVHAFAAMIEFQHYGVSKAAYYNSEEKNKFCGLYDFDGTPKNHFYSMKGFNLLRQGETEVECRGGRTDWTTAMACGNGRKAFLAFTNQGKEAAEAEFEIAGLGKRKYEVLLFDETHRFTPVRRGVFSGQKLKLALEPDTAAIIRFFTR